MYVSVCASCRINEYCFNGYDDESVYGKLDEKKIRNQGWTPKARYYTQEKF